MARHFIGASLTSGIQGKGVVSEITRQNNTIGPHSLFEHCYPTLEKGEQFECCDMTVQGKGFQPLQKHFKVKHYEQNPALAKKTTAEKDAFVHNTANSFLSTTGDTNTTFYDLNDAAQSKEFQEYLKTNVRQFNRARVHV